MQLVHIRLFRLTCLLYLDGSAHHDVERSPIREYAHVVIEHPSCMEQGNGKPQHFFYDELCLVDQRVLFRLYLIIQFVFYVESKVSQCCPKILR